MACFLLSIDGWTYKRSVVVMSEWPSISLTLSSLPIDYDAVVSAVSQPVTEQDVLSVVFVLEWAKEQPYG